MITLNGNNNDILSISLNDILLQIENIDEYHWKLIWLNGVSYELDILDLENRINKSLDGLIINSNELKIISNAFYQLIEIVLIGDKNIDNLHKLKDDNLMKKNNDFFIELVDSSYWEITSKDNIFMQKIEKTLL